MPASERERQPTVVRLSDLSSIVVAVEHMVGFRPAESLVAVALCGPRERMSFSLRLDLPGPGDGDAVVDAIAAEVAKRMAKARADAVMLFVHSDAAPVDGRLPHQRLVDIVTAGLEAPLREATLVGPERLWSYLCDDDRCCPAGGRPIERQSPAALTLAAEHAALGNVVLGSRDELVATVRPLGGIAATSMRQAQDRAIEAMLDRGLVGFADDVGQEIDSLSERFADPRASLTDDEAARVAIGLGDRLLRDRMFVRLSDPHEEGLRRLLSAVARRAQPPDDAAVCTCVGYAAYLDGSGVIAGAAFERALDTDPSYLMALYLATMLEHQIAPEEVRKCGADIDREVERRIRSRRRRR
ncbi:MAG TPA: DUF4192 domain-containing protein [Mycobacteriales bacterium]|jgi:hypothetical protein|nr:DUF4192 domain-containing protein [Mycobacteriales bacterium]